MRLRTKNESQQSDIIEMIHEATQFEREEELIELKGKTPQINVLAMVDKIVQCSK